MVEGSMSSLEIETRRNANRAFFFPFATIAASAAVARTCVAMALGTGAFLRLWHINLVGYNSDEAVYAGQAAALAGDPEISRFFPIFRAHPMIFQVMLATTYELFGVRDITGRLLAALLGLVTVILVYRLGNLLYGRWCGVVAALLMAVMPYHVIVTRQVLLDGPMTLFTTLALYLLARYAKSQRPAMLYATGAALGLTFLTKETGFVVAASVYAFLALTPTARLRMRDIFVSGIFTLVPMVMFPLSIALAGRTSTAKSYLVWQLFRRGNHEWTFFPTVVPPAIGLAVIGAALLGLLLLRRERTWRETLLVAWILVPVTVFQLWPVKGFQYLLPVAPAVAILAARTLTRWPGQRYVWVRPLFVGIVLLSLVLPSWDRLQPSTSTHRLAGAGGIPGGREVGVWIRENTPRDAVFIAIGPSMANLIQFYGHHRALGLSVSSNPLHRNPSYQPVGNPDARIRNGEVQYLVWDAYTASRTTYFTERLMSYVEKYRGHEVHRENIDVPDADGNVTPKAVIIVYEVSP
jgi:hypothetical protein